MVLHVFVISWDFANFTQTSFIFLQRVFCLFSGSDHNIKGLKPKIKQMYTLQKAQQLEIHQMCSENHRTPLVQVDGGQAVDTVHLL